MLPRGSLHALLVMFGTGLFPWLAIVLMSEAMGVENIPELPMMLVVAGSAVAGGLLLFGATWPVALARMGAIGVFIGSASKLVIHSASWGGALFGAFIMAAATVVLLTTWSQEFSGFLASQRAAGRRR